MQHILKIVNCDTDGGPGTDGDVVADFTSPQRACKQTDLANWSDENKQRLVLDDNVGNWQKGLFNGKGITAPMYCSPCVKTDGSQVQLHFIMLFG